MEAGGRPWWQGRLDNGSANRFPARHELEHSGLDRCAFARPEPEGRWVQREAATRRFELARPFADRQATVVKLVDQGRIDPNLKANLRPIGNGDRGQFTSWSRRADVDRRRNRERRNARIPGRLGRRGTTTKAEKPALRVRTASSPSTFPWDPPIGELSQTRKEGAARARAVLLAA